MAAGGAVWGCGMRKQEKFARQKKGTYFFRCVLATICK